jgi:3-oxoacyl-[acyl-carrier protein] reductase
MTADLMSAAPEGGPDPLDPRHVTPLVTYLASPAAAGINGEVFVVHGGVAALMAAPSVKAVARAADNGSADGMWTLDSIAKALGPMFGDEPSGGGFACDETANLADETIGIQAKGN